MPRASNGVTGLGAGLIVLIMAGAMALPDGDDLDPDRCRGVTRAGEPTVVMLAGTDCVDGADGADGVDGAAASVVRGTVRYVAAGRCFVLDLTGGDPPDGDAHLIVWPDGSRPVAGARPSVFVPDRSAGTDFRGGTVTVGDAIEASGPANLERVDRVSAPCRKVVGDRVAALGRVKISAR